MNHDKFVELHELFPSGRYEVNSLQLRDILLHEGCKGVAVRVLHLGTMQLELADVAERLKVDHRPRLDGIKITCLEGLVIIDEPSRGEQ